MSIGAIFYVIGILVALFALIGIAGLGLDDKTVLMVLLFYGLGGALGGIVIPFNRG